jgi:hypothetical protein
MGYNAVESIESQPTFRRNISFLVQMFLRNFGSRSQCSSDEDRAGFRYGGHCPFYLHGSVTEPFTWNQLQMCHQYGSKKQILGRSGQSAVGNWRSTLTLLQSAIKKLSCGENVWAGRKHSHIDRQLKIWDWQQNSSDHVFPHSLAIQEK